MFRLSYFLTFTIIIFGIYFGVNQIKTPVINNHDHMSMVTITDDKSFIENMIPHHEEAVVTSKILLEKGSYDEDFTIFLNNVVTAQTMEISQMKKWYKDWFGIDYQDNGKYMAMMNTNLEKLPNEEAKTEYIKGMLLHHQGAIKMAKEVLAITDNVEIKDLANVIIKAQEAEVIILKNWLTK